MIMKSRYLEDINNEVIEELSNYVFTPSVDFKKWDTISVSEDGEYIELYRDDVTQTPVYDSKLRSGILYRLENSALDIFNNSRISDIVIFYQLLQIVFIVIFVVNFDISRPHYLSTFF